MNLLDLSAELLLAIFETLDTPALYNLLTVCRQIYHLVKDGPIYRHICFASLQKATKFLLYLQRNLHLANQVISLDFIRCMRSQEPYVMSPTHLVHLLPNLARIRNLPVLEAEMEPVMQQLGDLPLSHLSFRCSADQGFCHPTFRDLLPLLRRSTTLKHLLVRANIIGTPSRDAESPPVPSLYAADIITCPLSRLRLSFVSNFEDEDLRRLMSAFRQPLKSLFISFCDNLTGDGICTVLALRGQRLEDLHIVISSEAAIKFPADILLLCRSLQQARLWGKWQDGTCVIEVPRQLLRLSLSLENLPVSWLCVTIAKFPPALTQLHVRTVDAVESHELSVLKVCSSIHDHLCPTAELLVY